ncbi:hypothetical protein K458DRAFT_119245 [Lentithecium fluviatile CBS 122367]|uniref:Uncharacterized protein n=1 Tax=Lentithecium fluviatile CBS 122367 TaxID=1168545 RepID=A0A6G1IML7_9PLEO|nr:hypothetical protein K458DRAFT_119245 [Lentithecium fluviatile CBS 122367]
MVIMPPSQVELLRLSHSIPSVEDAPPIRSVIPCHTRTRSLGDDAVCHLHEALIPSEWSQDAPPLTTCRL